MKNRVAMCNRSRPEVGINLKMGYSSWRIPLGSGILITNGVSGNKIRGIGPGIDLEVVSRDDACRFREKYGAGDLSFSSWRRSHLIRKPSM